MTDLQILKQIEKQLGVEFQEVSFDNINFEHNDNAVKSSYPNYRIAAEFFSDKNNNIIALNITKIKIFNLDLICRLKNIKKLYLSKNQISDISALKSLKKITELYLTDNLINDISVLCNLTLITEISLDFNQIKDISALKNLNHITYLSLWNNQINEISALKDLKRIRYLDLSDNMVNKVTELSNIKYINLGNNQINDILALNSLQTTEELLLHNNQINDISPLITLYKRKGFGAELENNPLKFPPKEIVELGKEAINEYFEHAEKGTSILQEAKLIIIGEAGAGKTTFAKKIINSNAEMPKPEDTTLGIDVHNWLFSEIEEQKFNVKLWDFGGQDIYHGTHQFFFSKKSLYVLLADAREQRTDFNYWLNTVEQLTGKNSPLVIVFNKKQNRDWQLDDEYGLKRRFGNIIRNTINIDLSNSIKIPRLQKTIKNEITNLPQIGYILPNSWINIRYELNKINDKFISFKEFRTICNQNGIIRPQVIKIISKLFSNIGIFTHFVEEDTSLQDIIFLDSNWLTKTVYSLLDNDIVKKKQGEITRDDINEILKTDEIYFEIDKFVELLKKFSLIYKINGSNNYIVPMHLKPGQPYKQWKYSEQKDIYKFRYLFDNYMPKGIMSRLIVALHPYIYNNKFVWTRGVNISNSMNKPDTYAEIIETYGRENRFDIQIYGKNQKDLLQRIIYHFDRILKPFTKLTHDKLVPCNCDTCKTSIKPHFYKYETLLKLSKYNKDTVRCEKEPFLDAYVNDLLEGINYTKLRNILANEKFEKFEDLISQRFSDISYQIHKEKVDEKFFHTIFHTILAENGLKPISEESTNDGRIDLHLTIGKTKYLFELKINGTPEKAIEQIQEKKYYKKFERDFRKIILIGINFNSQKRNIDGLKTINLSELTD